MSVMSECIAKSTFTSMNKVLTSRNIDMAVRLRVFKYYVWSILLYGCGAWTISSGMMKKLEAFETWLYRKILRISWKDRITNGEVYRLMSTDKTILGDIVRRQFGHVLWKDELEKLVVTGFVDDQRVRGRQRETFLIYLGKMKQKTQMELLQWLRVELFSPSCVYSNLCLMIIILTKLLLYERYFTSD